MNCLYYVHELHNLEVLQSKYDKHTHVQVVMQMHAKCMGDVPTQTCCCCRCSKSTGLISPLVSPLDPPSLPPPPSDWLLRLLTPFWLDGVVRMVSEADSTIITGTYEERGGRGKDAD